MIKRKIKKSIIYIFMCLCLVGMIYSSIKIIMWKNNVDNNNQINKEIKESIKVDKDHDIKIDFKSLKKQNKDTIAYIKVNNTNIDYIVVKGNDNDYYLKHNFNREYNIAGWVFSDYKNKFDGTDKNIVVYGHNTKDGSMFGTLNKTLESKWQENKDNLEITFITENEESKYRVFSTYIIVPENYYITTNFKNDIEFNEFINTIKKRSNYDYNVEVNYSDVILTLSSCNTNGTKRYVLHAKLVK